MRRVLGGLITMLALVLLTSTAGAQDYPPPTAPPPPAACTTSSVSASGPMLPGATVDVTVAANSILAGSQYSGTLQSTPVALAATTAATAGLVAFPGVKLPADWALNASHSVNVVDVASGQSVCVAGFFVDARGNVLAAGTTPGGGPLPRTGSDSNTPVKVGAMLVAAGAGAVLLARRRRSRRSAGHFA